MIEKGVIPQIVGPQAWDFTTDPTTVEPKETAEPRDSSMQGRRDSKGQEQLSFSS